jgi:ABC-2 type transport system permease protein
MKNGAFVYLLFLAVFVSSAFVPTDTMGSVLRTFAEYQPLTPIVETMRSLLVDGSAGNDVWAARRASLGLVNGGHRDLPAC